MTIKLPEPVYNTGMLMHEYGLNPNQAQRIMRRHGFQVKPHTGQLIYQSKAREVMSMKHPDEADQ